VSFRASRPGALRDSGEPSGWAELGGVWVRIDRGHRLEVRRDPRGGPWRWSLNGQAAPRPARTREEAMRLARLGARLGRVPSR
jgi:hypothetical protein